MARVLLLLFGLAFAALGGYLCFLWWDAVRMLLMGLVAVGILLIGLLFVLFGASELAGARPAQSPIIPPPQQEGS